jgi:hypothetical protein
MKLEDIIAEIEKQLGPLDEKARKAVELAVAMAAPQKEAGEVEWQGENPPFDLAAKMPPQQRGRLLQELEQLNRKWLERKASELGARWLLVIDGEVVRFGKSPADILSDEEMEAICRKRGKLPLLFFPLRPVEETVRWHATQYANDAYPTLPLRVSNGVNGLDLVADFDTGASEVYLDAFTLEEHGVIHITDADAIYEAQHLGLPFDYVVKALRLGLIAEDGQAREVQMFTVCVLNWRQSPFVAINPNRTALVGRDLCLALQPIVTLNFANRTTSLAW